MSSKTAFITGASRGIGKSCAVFLARAGYDVAISARTVREGEAREHSSTLKKSNTTPLPGSLEATAALVEAEGREAFMVPADLLDAASLGAAAARLLDHWGAPDIVVHNGRYIGPGHMDRFLDTPIELLEKQIWGNVLAPLTLNKLLLPERIAQDMGEYWIPLGAPSDVIGALVAWIATEPEAKEFNGGTIEAQYFVHERGLLP